MGIVRAEVIVRMRKAFRAGKSAGRFFQEERSAGRPLYRRTDMLADWRTVNELERKEGALRFVRKDYYPAKQALAEVEWKLSTEYKYTIKLQSRLKPAAVITERFVAIMSDMPLTPAEVERQVIEAISEWEEKYEERYVGYQLWSAIHRVI